jgi:hypothetical protein
VELDTCGAISVKFSITLTDLSFLNPQINATCGNLWLDTAYCVQAIGSISTYPGYPTTIAGNRPYTLTSETFTTGTWSTVAPNAPSIPAQTDKPLAPGTWSNCTMYKNGVKKPPFVDQSQETMDRETYLASDLYCNNTAAAYGITTDYLLTWNPSLVAGNSASNCSLMPSYRYCTLAGSCKSSCIWSIILYEGSTNS